MKKVPVDTVEITSPMEYVVFEHNSSVAYHPMTSTARMENEPYLLTYKLLAIYYIILYYFMFTCVNSTRNDGWLF